MKQIKDILANSSLKITPQRLAILKEMQKKGHVSIEEIYEEIKEQFPTISLATIYKNINALKEEGIITEVCIHPKSKYEIISKPHAHLICKECGKIEDIDMPKELETLYPNSIQKEVYIYIKCKSCDANQ